MALELSVIIVNYNGQSYLKNCIQSLQVNLANLQYEIIVLDNNSADDSCSYLRKNHPEVVLIESKINFGFGKGNNEAVKMAKGAFLLLINNDTIVLDNLKPVLQYLKADNTIGAIGINMRNAKKEYLPVAGVFPNFSNMFQMKKLLDINTEFKSGNFENSFYEVDWLSGSFLMMQKANFELIQGFDEDYFLYVEDVDFSKRLQKANLKRIFLPNYHYIHFVGFNQSKNPLLVKGYQIYIKKHSKGIRKLIMQTILATNNVVKKIKQKIK
jgi:GT2 family glycosyltransferase